MSEDALVDTAVLCLAVARLTGLVTRDRVPFGALRDRIERAGQRHARRTYVDPGDKQAGLYEVPPAWAELIGCPWCVSVHVGLAAVAVTALWPRAARPVLRALAASQVAGLTVR